MARWALLSCLVLAGAGAAEESNPVRVRVVGPTGLPLPDVGIGFATDGKVLGRTDASGVLDLADVPRASKLRILDPTFAPRGGAPVAVAGDELLLRSDVGIDARVVVVDAETGEPAPDARWWVPEPGGAKRESRILLWRPGHGGTITIEGPDGREIWLGPMSYFAKSVSAVVPVRKPVTIELLVRDHEGNAAPGVTVTTVPTGGVEHRRCVTDSAGRARLDVPHYREGRVTLDLRAGSGDLVAAASWTTKLGWDYKPRIDGSASLPAPGGPGFEGPKDNSSIGIGGSGHPPAPEQTGQLLVRARRSGGQPAAGIPVTLRHESENRVHRGTLDAKGEARFDAIATGPWIVDLEVAGFLGGRTRVEVGAKGAAEVDLTEPRGGGLEVTVVDRKDRPLPFAALWLQRPGDGTWIGRSCEIDAEGRQRVDLFTDEKGFRALHGLPPGALEVRAWYGARKGGVTVRIAPGEPGKTRIVLDDEP